MCPNFCSNEKRFHSYGSLSLLPTKFRPKLGALYNPDCNGDGCYAADDLLCFLSLFGLDRSKYDPIGLVITAMRPCRLGDSAGLENLRSVKYANGDDIPSSLTDSDGTMPTTAAPRRWRGLSPTTTLLILIHAILNGVAAYGRLYNWYAVNDERGLCPSGWHVPTEGEWYDLVSQFGGYSSAVKSLNPLTDGVTQVKAQTKAVQRHARGKETGRFGIFLGAGDIGVWWTATPYSSLARFSELKFNSGG